MNLVPIENGTHPKVYKSQKTQKYKDKKQKQKQIWSNDKVQEKY